MSVPVTVLRPDQPSLRDPDQQNLVGTETGRHRLSHTRLSVFLACHRKYDLDYIRRLEPIRKARSLSLGAAFQKGVELQDPEAAVRALNGWTICEDCHGAGAFRVDQATGELVPHLAAAVDPGVDGRLWTDAGEPLQVCEHCVGAGWVPPEEPLSFWDQQAEDQHRIDEVIVRSAAKLYLATWPAPAAEQREFEYLIRLRSPWTGRYSNTFDLHGYADGLVPLARDVRSAFDPDRQVSSEGPAIEFDADGRPVLAPTGFELIENKLVGQVNAIMVKRLPLDRQLALERYATWRVTGLPVLQARYRWIKKPSIKPKQGRLKDGVRVGAESIDQFLDRLAEDYEARPDFYTHAEDPKWVTMDDLLRVECELWEWAEDVRAKQRDVRGRRRLFDRNTSHCSEYGGCKFLPICTGDPDAMSLYRVRPPRVSTLQESAPEADE